MPKNKNGFTIKLEDEKWGRTTYHRPTRSMKDRRRQMSEEDLWKEAQGFDEEEDDREKFV